MNNKNTTRIVVIITACMLFISAVLTPQFVSVLASKRFKQYKYDLPAETKNIVHSIDSLEAHKLQYLKFLGISGWAFINDKNAYGSRISLVLKSDKNTYFFSSNPTRRYDVAEAFNTFALINSGFLATIPWSVLEDGEYAVGLFIKNDNSEAFQYTDKIISKYGDSVFTFNTSARYEFPLPMETDDIMYAIDNASISDEDGNKLFIVTGWGYIKGQNSFGTSIYVILKSKEKTYIYGSAIQYRPDVTEYFKTINFDDSGFLSEIPMESIDNGTYNIGIYIRKGNKESLLYTDKIINKSLFGAAFR
jgi:hypothetical protein